MNRTAFEKIMDTAIAMRDPADGAEGPELAIATLTQALSMPQPKRWLEESHEKGDLDSFLHVLAVWLVAHRSDSEAMLLIVPVPRNRSLPAGTILKRVDEAAAVALAPPPDLTRRRGDGEADSEEQLDDVELELVAGDDDAL